MKYKQIIIDSIGDAITLDVCRLKIVQDMSDDGFYQYKQYLFNYYMKNFTIELVEEDIKSLYASIRNNCKTEENKKFIDKVMEERLKEDIDSDIKDYLKRDIKLKLIKANVKYKNKIEEAIKEALYEE